jgi:hypothetical protein
MFPIDLLKMYFFGVRLSIGSIGVNAKAKFGSFLLVVLTTLQPVFSYPLDPNLLHLSQFTPLSFDSWRPYNNSSRLVQVGMNKGEVITIAGKPDYEESYYQRSYGFLTRISDWYYVRTGLNNESTHLKFSGDTLVRIAVTPIQ